MPKRSLSKETRAQILHLLCEGSSIRAITRMTGASKNTVAKLLRDAGCAVAAYQDEALRNLKCERVQVDEIWSFVGSKEKNTSAEKKAQGNGDSIALHCMYYNFVRIHKTLRVTPAMAAGVTTKLAKCRISSPLSKKQS